MTDEDYRLMIKSALASLEKLMSTEFLAVKNSQVEGHRFAQEQLDHVYEVIKIISKKLDEQISSFNGSFSELRAEMKETASTVNTTRETLANALALSVREQSQASDLRFGRLESMQSKIIGAIALASFLVPVVLYLIEHHGND